MADSKVREHAVVCMGLRKQFGAVPAVEGVNLTVARGEIVALLGPSGCGKTTTMRLIAGFEHPDAGTIAIGGKIVAGNGTWVAAEKRQIGMVFQSFALFPHMTVAENIGYGLPRGERPVRTKELLALVEMRGLEDRLPHQLSGGQQQRVALARALAPRPMVLLLDEPFSGLDASLRDLVRGEVLQILRASGTTTILVTHNQEEALHLGDRIAVMNRGVIEQCDRAEELFLHPATRFVAEFLGTAAFLPAHIVSGGIETELGFYAQPSTSSNGDAVDVLVRPDDLALEANPAGNAHIVDSIYRGGDYLYRVRLASGVRLTCLGSHARPLAHGDVVDVRIVAGHALACFPARGAGGKQ